MGHNIYLQTFLFPPFLKKMKRKIRGEFVMLLKTSRGFHQVACWDTVGKNNMLLGLGLILIIVSLLLLLIILILIIIHFILLIIIIFILLLIIIILLIIIHFIRLGAPVAYES